MWGSLDKVFATDNNIITKAMLLVYVAILLGYCASCLSSASQVQIHERSRFRAQETVRPPSNEASTQSATTETVATSITERAPSPRDHFIQLLRDYYTHPYTGGSEELASFFSISEMYRLGPLATDPRVQGCS